MSSTDTGIFETIFQQSFAPTILLKAVAPNFEVVAQNAQYRSLNDRFVEDPAGKPAFDLLVGDPENEYHVHTYNAMATAFQTCIDEKVIVKLPPVLRSEAVDKESWLQSDVLPVLDSLGNVEYLICQTYDISKQIQLSDAALDGVKREQDLTEELAATNEELSASNEELLTSNKELRLSQEQLSESNRELEHRVDERTKALSASETRFRSMVEQSPVPMLVTMGEATIFDIINQPMLDLIGKDASVIGMPWREAMPELDGQDIIKQMLDTYDAGESWQGSEVPIMIYKSGVPVLGFYNITYKPLLENGKTIGMLQSAIDVTDLVKSRLMVEELNREQQAANEELAATNEEMVAINEDLSRAQQHLQYMVAELAASKQHLELMINILPAAVVVIAGDDLIAESINNTNLVYWQKTRDEVIGKPLLEILPELANQPFPGQLRQVMATGEIIDIKESPVLFNAADGSERETFVDYTYQPIADADGVYRRVLVMSFEITDRVLSRRLLERYADEMQALNEKLRASNEELAAVNEELRSTQQSLEEGRAALRLAIDAAQFGTWFIHSVTRQFITDARLKEMFGYCPDEELSIEQALAQITDDYRGYVSAKLENAIYNGGDYDVTYPVVGFHDSKLRWLRAVGKLKADPSGEFSAFTGVVMDVSEIKQAEAESARLAAIITSSDDAIISKTLESVITTWNSSAERIFGYKADEMIGESIYKLIPEDRKDEEPRILSRLRNGERVEHFETKRQTKDGRLIDVSVTVSPIKDTQGNIIGLSKIARDISERKQDEARKNDFIAMVSHELKTPLTSLNAYLQIMQLKAKNAEDSFTPVALNNAVKQVKRMTTMINGFLNVSRLESGKIYIDKKRFDMANLIIEMKEETRSLYSSHQFVFHPVEATLVDADHDKIGQVINNFINNAVKYSKPGTEIQISCVQIGGFTQVSVKDEGLGIAREELPRLFERYYRVNNYTSISGFGIGLYLCAEIVQRHEGRIWADSEPGNGSTFYFTFPLSKNNQ